MYMGQMNNPGGIFDWMVQLEFSFRPVTNRLRVLALTAIYGPLSIFVMMYYTKLKVRISA